MAEAPSYQVQQLASRALQLENDLTIHNSQKRGWKIHERKAHKSKAHERMEHEVKMHSPVEAAKEH